VSVTYPTSVLQLTDDEHQALANVAVQRLRALDLPCPAVVPALRRTTALHLLTLISATPPPIAERSCRDERVSVCVCVFVCPRSYLRSYTSDLHPIYCACWPWLGPPCGVVIRYVFPVLWMTSYLLISQGCSTSPPS